MDGQASVKQSTEENFMVDKVKRFGGIKKTGKDWRTFKYVTCNDVFDNISAECSRHFRFETKLQLGSLKVALIAEKDTPL